METALALKREPEFRLATLDDLSGILELYNHLHSSEQMPPLDEKVKKIWNQILSDSRMFCFVVAQGENLLATCTLDIVPNLTRGLRPFGVLQNVVTHSDARGQGIGRKLINEAVKFAWDRDCYQILVQTGQPEAIPFYEKLGFRQDKVGFVLKPGWEST